MTKLKKGFTLIELMVVMAIIAVLAVLMIGAIQLARTTATETIHRANAKTIQTALEGKYAKDKTYPTLATVSFKAAATTLGVTLTDTCAVAGKENGGTVQSGPTTYTITPFDSKCGGALGVTDIIEVK